jgi:hypothetical protein
MAQLSFLTQVGSQARAIWPNLVQVYGYNMVTSVANQLVVAHMQ